MQLNNAQRILLGIVAVTGLVAVFIFQRVDFSAFVYPGLDGLSKFMVNRIVRFFINDFLAIALILALFPERKYIVFALWVQLAGVVLILLPYFGLKVIFPAYNGPLISHLHRLILNPTILLLLIPAFYYQKRTTRG